MAVLLAMTPLVSASWSSFGAYEPDTSYDTSAWMWEDAGPALTKPRIYFNAWSAAQAIVNFNVATLETSNAALNEERPSAMLGVWIDCNGDGYVGHIESALYEYSSALLLDTTACPPVTGGDDDNWTAGVHNYNGWVTELIPITPIEVIEEGDTDWDTRHYEAKDVRVWADVGTPGESSETSGGGSCALTPLPRGTLQSTGGLLNYLDCGNDLLETYNTAAANVPGAPVFEDEDEARGSFADVGTFGSEDSKHAAVTTRDCTSNEVLFDSSATANDTGVAGPVQIVLDAGSAESGEDLGQGYEYYGFSVPSLQPEVGNTQDPNGPGQLNQTNEELLDDCDTSNDPGHDFYSAVLGFAPEGDQTSVPSVGKNAVDWSFAYDGMERGEPVRFDAVDASDSEGSAGMANDLGLGATRGATFVGASWFGQGNLLRFPPVPIAVRTGLNAEDPTATNPAVVAAPGEWVTFFAFVSPDVTDRFTKTAGSGVYGAEQCGAHDEGIHNGWDCDADNWNVDEQGNKVPGQELLAAVGQPYNFRDVDCYDGSSSAFRWSDVVDPEEGEGCTRLA